MNFARNDIRDLRSGVKMGRIPKLVKERALREQREQQLKEEAERTATSDRTGEVHAREASCSSTSDGSIENYDPDTMPAGNRARAIETSQPLARAVSFFFSDRNAKVIHVRRPIVDRSGEDACALRSRIVGRPIDEMLHHGCECP